MKVAVSLSRASDIPEAEKLGADMVEVRLDLAEDPVHLLRRAMERAEVPVILTLRSRAEGGNFAGDPAEWMEKIGAFAGVPAYVDVEERFSSFSEEIRESGSRILASLHTAQMPSRTGFRELIDRLRAYGDLPKLVVEIRDLEDLLMLLGETMRNRPVCTGICGSRFRFARLLLPLFGSEIAYCHMGDPTAEGQYHITEFRRLYREISGGEGWTGRSGQDPRLETVEQGIEERF